MTYSRDYKEPSSDPHATIGVRFCHSAKDGGKPHDALIWVGQKKHCACCGGSKQFDVELTDHMRDRMATYAPFAGKEEEKWEEIQVKLRKAYSPMFAHGFKKQIDIINDTVLIHIGVHAVYSAWGHTGQKKAVCFYTEEIWDEKVVESRKKRRAEAKAAADKAAAAEAAAEEAKAAFEKEAKAKAEKEKADKADDKADGKAANKV